MRPRLWLADHLLRDGVGHHAGYNRCIADAARASGCEPVVASHLRLAEGLMAGHRVEKIFRTDWRADPPRWAASSPVALGLLEKLSARRFRADLARLERLIGSDDLVYAQMIAPRHFAEWLDWMQRLKAPPHLVLQLGYQPHRFRAPRPSREPASLPGRVREKIFFVTDSEKLVEPFAAAIRAKVVYLPHVVDLAAGRVDRRSAQGMLFFVPGNARREKGFADVVAALSRIQDLLSKRSLRIRIQCHEPDRLCREILRRRPSHEGVEWLEHRLEGGQYADAFAECDAVLLPYHLDHYADRGSGIFCEARFAGKPVIATRGTWAGDRVAREGGGWLCGERDPESLAAALRNAAATRAKVAGESARLRSAAREEFDPARFVDRLFSLTGHACR